MVQKPGPLSSITEPVNITDDSILSSYLSGQLNDIINQVI